MLPSLPLNSYHVSVYFLLLLGGENIQDPVSYFKKKKNLPSAQHSCWTIRSP